MVQNDRADQYDVVEFPAILDIVNKKIRSRAKPLWPEFFDLNALLRMTSMPHSSGTRSTGGSPQPKRPLSSSGSGGVSGSRTTRRMRIYNHVFGCGSRNTQSC